jgi:hypothetical protein
LPVLVLIFVFALATLLLSSLSALLTDLPALAFLLSGLIAVLTRLPTLLLPVLLHVVCHKTPPSGAQHCALNC